MSHDIQGSGRGAATLGAPTGQDTRGSGRGAATPGAPASQGIVIEEAGRAEYPAISDVLVDAYSDYPMPDDYKGELFDLAGHFEPDFRLWTARLTQGGPIAGAFATSRDPAKWAEFCPSPDGLPELSFRILGVARAHRGQGVAEALVRHSWELARQAGYPRVSLYTGEPMTGAHRLYEKLGFERHPERDHWLDGEHHLICYAKTL